MTEKSPSIDIRWDGNAGLVRARATGVIDEAAARYVLEQTRQQAHAHGPALDWLIDLSAMTRATSRARALLAEASGHPSIRSYAFFGASVFVRTVANFILAAADQKRARHFSNEADAMAWINGRRK